MFDYNNSCNLGSLDSRKTRFKKLCKLFLEKSRDITSPPLSQLRSHLSKPPRKKRPIDRSRRSAFADAQRIGQQLVGWLRLRNTLPRETVANEASDKGVRKRRKNAKLERVVLRTVSSRCGAMRRQYTYTECRWTGRHCSTLQEGLNPESNLSSLANSCINILSREGGETRKLSLLLSSSSTRNGCYSGNKSQGPMVTVGQRRLTLDDRKHVADFEKYFYDRFVSFNGSFGVINF